VICQYFKSGDDRFEGSRFETVEPRSNELNVNFPHRGIHDTTETYYNTSVLISWFFTRSDCPVPVAERGQDICLHPLCLSLLEWGAVAVTDEPN